ncbi:MAG: heme ABC exporter ATP-binding protein CcmA [Alphaproteobacteria bacterium]
MTRRDASSPLAEAYCLNFVQSDPVMHPPFSVSLEARAVACERGGRILFEGLSFALGPGEALLVRGPNGVGKTSLLCQLAGLLPLAAGSLQAQGAEAEIPFSELCHYVGHLNASKNALTVQENLAFWADFLGEGAGDFGGALAAFGLEKLASLPASLLSAGQKRKLALSRLFAAPRPIWLLDEPSVSLDDIAVKRLDAAIADHLREGGITIVSTHMALKTKFAHTVNLGLEEEA